MARALATAFELTPSQEKAVRECDKLLQNFSVKTMEELSAEDWQAFHRTVVTPNIAPDRKRGQYAVAVRKQAAHAVTSSSTSE